MKNQLLQETMNQTINLSCKNEQELIQIQQVIVVGEEQKSNTSKISDILSKAYCSSRNKAKTICINPQCCSKSLNPFICEEEQCISCSDNHVKCEEKKVNLFIKCLNLNNNIKKNIEHIINTKIDKVIDQISELKEKLIQKLYSEQFQPFNESVMLRGLTKSEIDSIIEFPSKINSTDTSKMWGIFKQNELKNPFKQVQLKIQTLTENFSTNLRKYLADIQNSFYIFSDLKIQLAENQVYWSQKLKGPSQNINGLKVKKISSDFDRFTMLQPSLSKIHGRYINWKIKITNLKSWIGVGICLRQFISSRDFKFEKYSEAQHGSYLASANGCCWLYKNLQQQRQSNCVPFITGDILNILMDKVKHEIKFKNQRTNVEKKVRVTYRAEQSKDQYYICVCLGGQDDEAQLILPVKNYSSSQSDDSF